VIAALLFFPSRDPEFIIGAVSNPDVVNLRKERWA